jgi:hypothetical protein
MKTNLLVRMLLAATSTLFFSSVHPQLSAERVSGSEKQTQPAKTSVSSADADNMARASLKSINTKMFSHFSRNFKDASNIRITTAGENTHVSFRKNGELNGVQYNRKGKWLYSIRYFNESGLSAQLKANVESNYPGYLVYGFAQEIKVLDKTALLVMIENKTSWKRIRIVDDVMDIFEEYNKPAPSH